jgi:hypothetical protein
LVLVFLSQSQGKTSYKFIDNVDAFLEKLNILVDSDVTIARRVSEKTFLLLEVYKRGAIESLVKKSIGDWSEGRGVRLTTSPVISVRRLNLHKTLIKAVTVVSVYKYFVLNFN